MRALEKAVEEEASWSRGFLVALTEAARDAEGKAAVGEMMGRVRLRRTRKRAIAL